MNKFLTCRFDRKNLLNEIDESIWGHSAIYFSKQQTTKSFLMFSGVIKRTSLLKSIQIRSFFRVRILLLFLYGINLCIHSEYRKIETRKENSIFRHFSRSTFARNRLTYIRSYYVRFCNVMYNLQNFIQIYITRFKPSD